MGIFSKWFGNSQPKAEQSEKVEKNEIWMKLSVSQSGNNVSINVHGLETVNVCLASFLTKGVSYAQEKFNEYQANKDTDAIVEEPKAEPKIKAGSVKEWQNGVKARERERIAREQAKKGGNV